MGASRAYISERSFDIEDKARQDYAERRFMVETAPDVLTFLRGPKPRMEPLSEPSWAAPDRPDRPQPHAERGDGAARWHADVLDKFTEHPLRQLELAKAYLESSEVTAHGPAMERVLDALAEEQIEAQRARHAAPMARRGSPMDKGKIAGGILSLTLVGLAIGYVVATGYLTLRYGLSTNASTLPCSRGNTARLGHRPA
jgi:type IV secretion system T-DNA border endonuclease VirD2